MFNKKQLEPHSSVKKKMRNYTELAYSFSANLALTVASTGGLAVADTWSFFLDSRDNQRYGEQKEPRNMQLKLISQDDRRRWT